MDDIHVQAPAEGCPRGTCCATQECVLAFQGSAWHLTARRILHACTTSSATLERSQPQLHALYCTQDGNNPRQPPAAMASMGREVKALQALGPHPNIVPLRAVVFSRARGMTVGVALNVVEGGDLLGVVR